MKMLPYKCVELSFHVAAFFLYVLTHQMIVFVPGQSDTYGGEYKFFTILNLLLSTAYFGFASLLDIKDLLVRKGKTTSDNDREIRDHDREIRDHDRKIRDYVFLSILFPVSFCVSFLFWGIYAVDSELMFPIAKQKYYALHSFYNHAIHTAPIITTLLESVLSFHRPPSRFWKGCIGWTIYATMYIAWILWIAYATGIWIYPFLKLMSSVHLFFFFTGTFLFGAITHRTSLIINEACWRDELINLKKAS